jgi:tetratricopeptide (TPR) repeat protein
MVHYLKILPVNEGDRLISDLRSVQHGRQEILVWILPEKLTTDIIDALNNFRELFYDAGIPSLVFLTPAALDDVILKAPDLWRYRGGYHMLKSKEYRPALQSMEALSTSLNFSYKSKEELLRRKSINEYLLDKMKDKQEKEKILAELGTIHFFTGETRKAIDYHEQALAIAREIGDRRGEGADLGNLGNAYAALGETRKAIDYYEQALTIYREIGDRRGEGNALWNMSLVLDELDERSEAIRRAESALEIYEQIESRMAAKVREQLAEWSK